MGRYCRFGGSVWGGYGLAAGSFVEEDVHQATQPSMGKSVGRGSGILAGRGNGIGALIAGDSLHGISSLGLHAGSI